MFIPLMDEESSSKTTGGTMQAAVVTGCTGAVGLGLIDALMKNNVKVIAVVRKDSKRSYRIKESHSLKKVECDLSET